MVRHPLFVEAGCHEDVIEHARLAFERPEGAALEKAGRDGLELPPAREAAVGLEHRVKEIAHGASVALLPCGSLASSDYVAAGLPVCPSIRARMRSEASRSCRSSAALKASMTRA